MIQAKCIEKIRDKNNHIIGYKLVDKSNNEVLVKAEKLKEVIREKQVDVINLTLTYDNRLIDKKQVTPSKPMTKQSNTKNVNVEAILNKVKATGCNIKSFNTACGHEFYVLENVDIKTVWLVIPDNVTVMDDCKEFLFKPFDDFYFNTITCDTLKVIGGSGLITTKCLFMNCNAKHLDLSRFDTINVVDMSWTFAKCKCNTIDFSGYKTHKAENMEAMFYECETESLDLRSFDTSNVTDMCMMFEWCHAKYIDLSSFDISKVYHKRDIFSLCRAKISTTSKKLAMLYNNKS